MLRKKRILPESLLRYLTKAQNPESTSASNSTHLTNGTDSHPNDDAVKGKPPVYGQRLPKLTVSSKKEKTENVDKEKRKRNQQNSNVKEKDKVQSTQTRPTNNQKGRNDTHSDDYQPHTQPSQSSRLQDSPVGMSQNHLSPKDLKSIKASMLTLVGQYRKELDETIGSTPRAHRGSAKGLNHFSQLSVTSSGKLATSGNGRKETVEPESEHIEEESISVSPQPINEKGIDSRQIKTARQPEQNSCYAKPKAKDVKSSSSDVTKIASLKPTVDTMSQISDSNRKHNNQQSNHASKNQNVNVDAVCKGDSGMPGLIASKTVNSVYPENLTREETVRLLTEKYLTPPTLVQGKRTLSVKGNDGSNKQYVSILKPPATTNSKSNKVTFEKDDKEQSKVISTKTDTAIQKSEAGTKKRKITTTSGCFKEKKQDVKQSINALPPENQDTATGKGKQKIDKHTENNNISTGKSKHTENATGTDQTSNNDSTTHSEAETIDDATKAKVNALKKLFEKETILLHHGTGTKPALKIDVIPKTSHQLKDCSVVLHPIKTTKRKQKSTIKQQNSDITDYFRSKKRKREEDNDDKQAKVLRPRAMKQSKTDAVTRNSTSVSLMQSPKRQAESPIKHNPAESAFSPVKSPSKKDTLNVKTGRSVHARRSLKFKAGENGTTDNCRADADEGSENKDTFEEVESGVKETPLLFSDSENTQDGKVCGNSELMKPNIDVKTDKTVTGDEDSESVTPFSISPPMSIEFDPDLLDDSANDDTPVTNISNLIANLSGDEDDSQSSLPSKADNPFPSLLDIQVSSIAQKSAVANQSSTPLGKNKKSKVKASMIQPEEETSVDYRTNGSKSFQELMKAASKKSAEKLTSPLPWSGLNSQKNGPTPRKIFKAKAETELKQALNLPSNCKVVIMKGPLPQNMVPNSTIIQNNVVSFANTIPIQAYNSTVDLPNQQSTDKTLTQTLPSPQPETEKPANSKGITTNYNLDETQTLEFSESLDNFKSLDYETIDQSKAELDSLDETQTLGMYDDEDDNISTQDICDLSLQQTTHETTEENANDRNNALQLHLTESATANENTDHTLFSSTQTPQNSSVSQSIFQTNENYGCFADEQNLMLQLPEKNSIEVCSRPANNGVEVCPEPENNSLSDKASPHSEVMEEDLSWSNKDEVLDLRLSMSESEPSPLKKPRKSFQHHLTESSNSSTKSMNLIMSESETVTQIGLNSDMMCEIRKDQNGTHNATSGDSGLETALNLTLSPAEKLLSRENHLNNILHDEETNSSSNAELLNNAESNAPPCRLGLLDNDANKNSTKSIVNIIASNASSSFEHGQRISLTPATDTQQSSIQAETLSTHDTKDSHNFDSTVSELIRDTWQTLKDMNIERMQETLSKPADVGPALPKNAPKHTSFEQQTEPMNMHWGDTLQSVDENVIYQPQSRQSPLYEDETYDSQALQIDEDALSDGDGGPCDVTNDNPNDVTTDNRKDEEDKPLNMKWGDTVESEANKHDNQVQLQRAPLLSLSDDKSTAEEHERTKDFPQKDNQKKTDSEHPAFESSVEIIDITDKSISSQIVSISPLKPIGETENATREKDTTSNDVMSEGASESYEGHPETSGLVEKRREDDESATSSSSMATSDCDESEYSSDDGIAGEGNPQGSDVGELRPLSPLKARSQEDSINRERQPRDINHVSQNHSETNDRLNEKGNNKARILDSAIEPTLLLDQIREEMLELLEEECDTKKKELSKLDEEIEQRRIVLDTIQQNLVDQSLKMDRMISHKEKCLFKLEALIREAKLNLEKYPWQVMIDRAREAEQGLEKNEKELKTLEKKVANAKSQLKHWLSDDNRKELEKRNEKLENEVKTNRAKLQALKYCVGEMENRKTSQLTNRTGFATCSSITEMLEKCYLPHSIAKRANNPTNRGMINDPVHNKEMKIRYIETRKVMEYIHGGQQGALYGAVNFLVTQAPVQVMSDLAILYKKAKENAQTIEQNEEQETKLDGFIQDRKRKYANYLPKRKFKFLCKMQTAVIEGNEDKVLKRITKFHNLTLRDGAVLHADNLVKAVDSINKFLGPVFQIPRMMGVSRTVTCTVLMVINHVMSVNHLADSLVSCVSCTYFHNADD